MEEKSTAANSDPKPSDVKKSSPVKGIPSWKSRPLAGSLKQSNSAIGSSTISSTPAPHSVRFLQVAYP
ncbi:unnamed protein product [Hermetia illucens]|uniref:Uncharacterized protein n=1 Tax=Hermetia illucens TaxID=343691 RepID=A0A7R8YYG1_HERIL|nr:unnamed protein product [Hermetia illucens]